MSRPPLSPEQRIARARLADGLRTALAHLAGDDFEGAANITRQLAQALPPPEVHRG
jgi:hypothetical protein